MITKVAVSTSGRALAKHLSRTDDGNERVRLIESRGTVAELSDGDPASLRRALTEMEISAHQSSRCERPFFHVSYSPSSADAGRLNDEKWERMLAATEKEFGLGDHQRVVVEHVKEGQTHRHCVWSRVNPDTGRAVSVWKDRDRCVELSRKMEHELGLERIDRSRPAHQQEQRPPSQWEAEQARRTHADAHAVRADMLTAWTGAENGKQFVESLEARGLTLARGDRRDFLVVDQAGNYYAVNGRALPGEKAGTIRVKLADVDRDELPTVEVVRRQRRAGHQLEHDHARRNGRQRQERQAPAERGSAARSIQHAERQRWRKQQKEFERTTAGLHAEHAKELKALGEKPGALSQIVAREKAAQWEKQRTASVEKYQRGLAGVHEKWSGAEARHKRRMMEAEIVGPKLDRFNRAALTVYEQQRALRAKGAQLGRAAGRAAGRGTARVAGQVLQAGGQMVGELAKAAGQVSAEALSGHKAPVPASQSGRDDEKARQGEQDLRDRDEAERQRERGDRGRGFHR